MSTSSKPQLTAAQIQETRAKFKRFRILVIGRANAGKTTILRAVCNTTDDPMIFDRNGKKIKTAILDPSLKRGEHNIENEMFFESNPGFVFHDSRGFEAGGDQELKLVQQFLQQRSEARNVNEQLHAIWYCIPTSDDRPITAAEKKFFNECGTGLVPVIVLWTKTEALDLDKIKQLMKEGRSKADAMQQAPEKAWVDFERDVYGRFAKFKYQLKEYVVFRKMHEPGGNCNELIEKTARALSSEELQQLFVSTQQNNVKLCIEYGIRGTMKKMKIKGLKYFERGNWVCFMGMTLEYFPHMNLHDLSARNRAWAWAHHDLAARAAADENASLSLLDLHDVLANSDALLGDVLADLRLSWNDLARNDLCLQSISTTMSDFLNDLPTQFNYKDATHCAIASAIIGCLTFFLQAQSPTQSQCSIFKQAAQTYQESFCQSSVKDSVENIFNCYSDQADILVKEAIQIALNNFLSMK